MTVTGQFQRILQNHMQWLHPSFGAIGNAGTARNLQEPILLAFNGPDSEIRNLFLPAGSAAKQQRFGFWLDGFSQFSQSSAGDFKGFDTAAIGGNLGLDYAFSDHFVAGVGGSFANTKLNFDSHMGQSNIQSYFASVYGTYFTDDS
jgi:outer membrane autotransporter protein